MSFYNLDTGVFIAPATRPSVFTNPTAPAQIAATDAGVATTPVPPANVFDDVSGATDFPSPGALTAAPGILGA
jgi:hypothetical protein